MFQQAFNLDAPEEKPFQNVSTGFVKVVGQSHKDINQTESQDRIVICNDLQMGFSYNPVIYGQFSSFESKGDRDIDVSRYDHNIRLESPETRKLLGILLQILTQEVKEHLRKAHVLRPVVEDDHRSFHLDPFDSTKPSIKMEKKDTAQGQP